MRYGVIAHIPHASQRACIQAMFGSSLARPALVFRRACKITKRHVWRRQACGSSVCLTASTTILPQSTLSAASTSSIAPMNSFCTDTPRRHSATRTAPNGRDCKIKDSLSRRRNRDDRRLKARRSEDFQGVPPKVATAGQQQKNQYTSANSRGTTHPPVDLHDHLFIWNAMAQFFRGRRAPGSALTVNASGSGPSQTALVRGCGGVGEKGPHAARHPSRVPSKTSRNEPASFRVRFHLHPFGLQLVEERPPNQLQVDYFAPHRCALLGRRSTEVNNG